ncbi:PqqD family protein [Arthrobacter sp. 31Y]|uniref:PqqD family protein n=1 Tax=Arthrobacter sp. 31Y TaxID=1115632 RepID=UPI000466544A|nr:PqqD family protein [Arthrobacter sp. 31Y]
MNQFWHRAKAVAEVPDDVEERLVVLNLERGSPLVLLGPAAFIWELIDGTRTENDILKELASTYVGADESSMAEHVRNFLAGLSSHGLAQVSDSPR